MRVVIQRVTKASVQIDDEITSSIGRGLLVLLGITNDDGEEDISWLCRKIAQLRIFEDEKGYINLSVKDINASVMVVSQFTLFASTKKGNRPSFLEAARPEVAIPIYEQFVKHLENTLGKPVATGTFGAMMNINLENNGPFTLCIDSKDRL